MPLNIEKYRPYLDEFDMSEEQKAEFIKAMWTIMQSFANQAFEQNPVNHNILRNKVDKNCWNPSKIVKYDHPINLNKKVANDNLKVSTLLNSKQRRKL